MYEPSSNLSQKRKSSRDLENEPEVRSEIQKHELQSDSDRRSIQELTGILDSQRVEIEHTIAGCEQSRRDQLLLQETRIRSMQDMEELQKSHVLKVEELSRRKLTEYQNTIMELARGMVPTGGGGPAKAPNLRVCKHLFGLGGTRMERRMN